MKTENYIIIGVILLASAFLFIQKVYMGAVGGLLITGKYIYNQNQKKPISN